jgi:hypothetical protein
LNIFYVCTHYTALLAAVVLETQALKAHVSIRPYVLVMASERKDDPLPLTASRLSYISKKRRTSKSKLSLNELCALYVREKLPFLWIDSSGEFDTLGCVMVTSVVVLSVIFPISWVLAFFYVTYSRYGLIPWEVVIDEWIIYLEVARTPVVEIILLTFHSMFCIPLILECMRALPFLIIFMVIPLQIYVQNISCMNTWYRKIEASSSKRTQLDQLLFMFKEFQILNIAAIPYTAAEVSCLFLVGGILSIAMNVACVRLHLVFPLYLYVVCPSVAIIVLLIIRMLLPYGIDVHEKSHSMLLKWKAGVTTDKYRRKKLESMKSVRWYCGVFDFNFFLIAKSIKMQYFSLIFNYTLEFLMAIPQSVFAQFKV